jgi:uncharacterized membrane protein YhhN
MTTKLAVVKHCGPRLVPFFKSVAVFFVIYPNGALPNFWCMLLKCLPIAALCLFVITHGISFDLKYSYSRRIIAGLVFSMIGDALLVFDDYFLFGLVSFAVAHVIYLTAFGIKPYNFRLLFALVAIGVPHSAVQLLFIDSDILKVMVPIYMLLILSMLWRAVSRLEIFRTKSNEWAWTQLCCSLGNCHFYSIFLYFMF